MMTIGDTTFSAAGLVQVATSTAWPLEMASFADTYDTSAEGDNFVSTSYDYGSNENGLVINGLFRPQTKEPPELDSFIKAAMIAENFLRGCANTFAFVGAGSDDTTIDLGPSLPSQSPAIPVINRNWRQKALRPKKGRYGPEPKVSDALLILALKKNQGDKKATARDLGLHETTVWKRIWRTKDPKLEAFGYVHKRIGRPLRISNTKLADTLDQTKSNRTAAAKLLGMSRPAISERVANAVPGTRLAKHRKEKPAEHTRPTEATEGIYLFTLVPSQRKRR